MWSHSTLTKLNNPEDLLKTAKAIKEAKYEKNTKVKKAKAKGWHANATPDIGAFCSNLHGEVSELWEQYRNDIPIGQIIGTGPSELVGRVTYNGVFLDRIAIGVWPDTITTCFLKGDYANL